MEIWCTWLVDGGLSSIFEAYKCRFIMFMFLYIIIIIIRVHTCKKQEVLSGIHFHAHHKYIRRVKIVPQQTYVTSTI